MIDKQTCDYWYMELHSHGGVEADGTIRMDVLEHILPADCSVEWMDSLLNYFDERGLSPDPGNVVNMEPDLDVQETENALARYVNLVRSIEPLTHQEEEDLLELVSMGDDRARKRLVDGYLKMVLNIAREKGARREEILEYIQEGNLGLLKAIELFDRFGNKTFRDFARWHIRKAVHKTKVHEREVAKIPAEIVKFFRDFRTHSEILRQSLKRTPELEEIAKSMEVPMARIRESLALGGALMGGESIMEDGDVHVARYVKKVKAAEELEVDKLSSLKDLITEYLEHLEPIEEEIISLYYGLGEDGVEYDFVEISEEVGLKTSMVRDLESAAMNKIIKAVEHARRQE
jgi:RNA polymerase sigma factor (sigma-70 family)